VEVDDRSGGMMRLPGPPWRFSTATLPPPGIPAFQGEHNAELLAERNIDPAFIQELRERRVLLSRRSIREDFDAP
jgi:CoA:oxalate CoA-transferase